MLIRRSPTAFVQLVPAAAVLVILTLVAVGPGARAGRTQAPQSVPQDYPIRPVPFTDVRLDDAFWAPRLETNRTVSVPYAFRMNEETGRVDNFRKAARLMSGPYRGRRYNDSDVYKAMEGAAYTLLLRPDPGLEEGLDDLVALIGKAQEPDGYLFTARTVDPKNPAPGSGPERWSNLRVSHELYNVGHMYDAAVAHYLATGKRTFLAIALKNASLLLRTFGTEPGQRRGFPGHQEVEIGLAKLYRVTGEKKYLDLAKFFLDERGHYHQGPYHAKDDPFSVYDSEEYMQNHKPVLEQDEAVGHAVRAMYMASGMADVAALGGYPGYVAAIDRLWTNVVGKKMYLTGGVGSRGIIEGFGPNYDLPNNAYAETCAAIGNALWNERLFLLHGESKYVDVLERVLYNGLLSGVSQSGDRFFYQNPLESAGSYARSPWFEVACCPPNLTRFLPSLPGYVYATEGDTIFVNLFIGGRARVETNGRRVLLVQNTRYPWDGTVRITVDPEGGSDEFEVAVRIPGWARNEPVPSDLYRFLDENGEKPKLRVNGKPVAINPSVGYARIRRAWKPNDEVELVLPMPVRRIVANGQVAADAGMAAIEWGPLVYCAEGVDNGGDILEAVLPDRFKLRAVFRPDLLKGVTVVKGEVLRRLKTPDGKSEWKAAEFEAVPYYAWANRSQGEMAVWFPRTEDAVRPRATRGQIGPIY
jgi:DUF1680 family protein